MTRYQPKPQPTVTDLQLPIDILWGIYARQSTPSQLIKHAESAEMRTEDLIKWLQDCNVGDNYELFDADLRMSGTLRIDERPALRKLMILLHPLLFEPFLLD